jgi:hypothetical protein
MQFLQDGHRLLQSHALAVQLVISYRELNFTSCLFNEMYVLANSVSRLLEFKC